LKYIPIQADENKPQHIVYVSVGSNMGNRIKNCRDGIAIFVTSANLTLLDQSLFYATEPVDYEDQDWFINAVIKIETDLDPLQLLQVIKTIQQTAGRVKDSIRFGPRVLDLDVLLYDNMAVSTPEIEIPHPRMHKRRFVLRSICDIDPTIIHPMLKKSMRFLLDQLDDNTQRV
jgi:2-amino-4-hydroxy-6-hydroxymethyldihydropteridine diphosphokinase